MELHDLPSPDDDEETVLPGPLWRHALWVAGITILGVGLGWASALFRIGPEEYGLPSAAPGAVWPYLVAWTAIGLAVAAALRAAAARVPVYAPGQIAVVLTALGTRLSLGWRPEAPVLGALAAAALTAAAIWCALALRSDSRDNRGRGITPGA
ncbi:hypothetical protein OG883_15755 [Streptomyces sp. NBC_01142]|uniref:hypothetical protein n=1 Tax=Streptomyces sp. NBC_01142 TaxID=2975865 RepID=UPI002258FE00|nr:hypothetical protein [Streptomyces sp. NBC_01142]MCX4821336.1 hypothetical protein [Streptomyces sp. NBC_01142]